MKRFIAVSGLAFLVISTALQAAESTPTSTGARTTTLVITPSRFDTGAADSLLVKAADQTEGDAVPFYDEAVANMPTNINSGQLSDWARAPLDELPGGEVEAFLKRAQPCLESITKAAHCKDCNWPAFVAGQQPEHLSEYRLLTYMVLLKARSEIASQQYEDAIGTMQTGMTMARQIGEAPTLVQGLVGIAVEAVMLRGVDDFSQAPESPNLYAALKALPRPLIDIETPINSELKALETSTEYSPAVRDAMREQMKPAYDRVRQLVQRSSSELGARQCIEGIRNYAATHDRDLPAQLSDIAGVDLPDDPITDKPYAYRVNDGQAVLETGVPACGSAREAMRFEITMAH